MFFIREYKIYIILICALCTDGSQYRFDYRYFPEVNGFIKFHEAPVTWQDARLRCHYEGAILASPSDMQLLKVMVRMVTDNRVESRGVFTGIHSVFKNGVYNTLEGVPISRIPMYWAPNEPDNYQSIENCLMMLVNGTMADVKCNDHFPFMCYKKNENIIINNCGTTDPGYSVVTKTGSCYKFHTTAEIWSKAYMICAAEGGHLAIINSEEEARILGQLFAQNPQQVIIGSQYKDSALIGLHDWGERGSWFTIHGQTLEEAGYAKWFTGQPDNFTQKGVGQYCGSIDRSVALDDYWCDSRAAFICEKNPTSLVFDLALVNY